MNLSLNEAKLGYDVVVVGSGPAGCMAASSLSKRFSVLLVDFRPLPRDKPCGGMLVNATMDFLDAQVGKSKDFLVEPNKLNIRHLDWDFNKEILAEKNFLNVDRKKFDSFLLDMVFKKKVSVVQGTKLSDFNYTKDKKFLVLVLECNGTVKTILAKYLVGCDGALSTVRRKIAKREIPYYLAVQEQIPKKIELEDALFIYDNSITDFYSWVIPKGKKLFVGSALDPSYSREGFALFKKKLEKSFGIRGSGQKQAAVILRPNSINCLCLGKANVLLAGEAAGLISPTSGEGISFALKSGYFVAKAIGSDKETIQEYKKSCGSLLNVIKNKLTKLNKRKKEGI